MELEHTRLGCGMLSSTDFLRLVVLEDLAKAKRDFWKRSWKEWSSRFIIDPFSPQNLTPFSYDLSIGTEVYSCRHEKVTQLISEGGRHVLEPGETIIIKTEEFLALPPEYSATVWPRFSMVTEAVFQSMVKIDPTWYGELGVAVTNLSAADYPIRHGDKFATLIIYELSSPTEMFLYRKEDCPDAEVIRFSENVTFGDITNQIENMKLGDLCRVSEAGLHLLRLPNDLELRNLMSLATSDEWKKAVLKGIGKYPKPMDALGLNSLEYIRPKKPKGTRLTLGAIRETMCTQDDLAEAAIAHGRPFEILHGIPDLVLSKIEHEISPRIRAEVESALFPKTVTLTLTVLGFLSLIVAVAAFLLDKYRTGSPFQGIDWPGTIAIVIIALSVVLIGAFCWLLFRRMPDSRALSRMRKEINELKRQLEKK